MRVKQDEDASCLPGTVCLYATSLACVLISDLFHSQHGLDLDAKLYGEIINWNNTYAILQVILKKKDPKFTLHNKHN